MAQLLDIGVFSVIDLDSSIGVGWKLNFYIAGTSTPIDTYPTEADALAGTNANANPVVISSDGRIPAIWLTASVKLILTDENDDVKETIPLIKVVSFVDLFEARMEFVGEQEEVEGWMGGFDVTRAMTFPVDLAGDGMDSRGHIIVNPAEEQVVSVKVNDVPAWTVTYDTDGNVYFSTDDWGGAVSCVEGDRVDYYGPTTPGSGAHFTAVFIAEYD